jgi:hypothetical protein
MYDGHRWKRLTVSEAAERLQISKDAVRKRMQRGTLRHDKTLDGHVYVYLHDEEDDDGTGESRGRVLQLSDVASLLAVVSLGTYIVGLFVFWYPISKTYTGDFATAWYATSLVSRNVIVGHGVQKLLLPYLALMLVVVVATLLSLYMRGIPRLGDKPKSRRIVIQLLLFLAAGGALYLLVAYYAGVADPVGLNREVNDALVLRSSSLVSLALLFMGVSLALAGHMLMKSRAEYGQHSSFEAISLGESLRRDYQNWRTHPRYYIALGGLLFAA